jgi:hypothetical protein
MAAPNRKLNPTIQTALNFYKHDIWILFVVKPIAMIAVEAIDEMLVGRGWMSVVVGWLDDDRAGGVSRRWMGIVYLITSTISLFFGSTMTT